MAQTISNTDHLFNSIIVKIARIIDISFIQKILAVNAISISLNFYNLAEINIQIEYMPNFRNAPDCKLYLQIHKTRNIKQRLQFLTIHAPAILHSSNCVFDHLS